MENDLILQNFDEGSDGMLPTTSCSLPSSSGISSKSPENTDMTINQLINQLVAKGGAIVTSGECSEMEIANAQATERFAVREDGIGFVLRPQQWLAYMRAWLSTYDEMRLKLDSAEDQIRHMIQHRERLKNDIDRLESRLQKISDAMESIVVTEGEDAGVVLLSTDAPCRYEAGSNVAIYGLLYFSPLGEALMEVYHIASRGVSDTPICGCMVELESDRRNDTCTLCDKPFKSQREAAESADEKPDGQAENAKSEP